jgi:hypothetical protein
MEYFIATVLTLLLCYISVKFIQKSFGINSNNIQYRQSDIYKILKPIYTNKYPVFKTSQLTKRSNASRIRVVSIEDKAYWVQDNVFYVANLVDDTPDLSTAIPVDTADMSKEDVEKMLLILDSLDRGGQE